MDRPDSYRTCLIVVASLLLAPLFTGALSFLRLPRGLQLFHAYHLLRDLRRKMMGFGDITMKSPGGKLLAAFVVVGIALFIRLARAVCQPSKVKYKYQGCDRNRCEPDVIHCKRCGQALKIETEGSSRT